MPDQIKRSLRSTRVEKWRFLPLFTSVILFLITLLSCYLVYGISEKRNEEYFKRLVEEIQNALHERYVLYEESLRGGLGLFYASNSVERREWTLFVKALQVEKTLPGINGVGFIDYVLEDDLDAYLERTRQDDAPDFTNHPETSFQDKFIIKFIEPVSINKEAVGLDIGFEANRRDAAEKARDFGVPMLTKKIELVQDHKNEPGFLLLLPFYETKEIPPSIDSKRKSFKGWVYAPFIGSNFFRGLSNSVENQIIFNVYDGEDMSDETLIYSSYTEKDALKAKHLFSSTTSMKIAGRIWTIKWSESPQFLAPSGHAQVWLVGILGALLSVFVYLVLKVLVRSQESIALEVEKRTMELEDIANFQRLMTNTIPDLLFVKDEKFRIVQANRAFLNLYPENIRGSVIGSTTIESYDKEEADEFLKNDRIAFETGSSSVEEKIHFPDGQTRELATQKVRFQNKTGEKFILGIAHDITELKKARERAIQATEKKSAFLATVSHEIRTPMNGIVGFSDILKDTELDSFQRRCLHKIDFAANSLLRIVNDTLDIQKIEAGKMVLESAPFNLRQVLQEALEFMEKQAVEKDVKFVFEYAETMPLYFMGDSVRLQQIIMNLLDNANKFTERGRVVLRAAYNQGHVEVAVEDTGIGISKEKQQAVFDSFTQEDTSTTRKFGGTGLGLTIVKKLVDQMNGTIRIESEKHKGTTFFMSIPMNESGAVSHEEEELLDEAQKDYRILLVEDTPMNQELTQIMLEKAGYKMDLAENGQIAVDMLKDKKYDLVLMDIEMPVMDGFTATKYIRTELGYSNLDLPIVGITAHAMTEKVKDFFEAGMDDFLIKPIKSKDLIKTIKTHLNDGSYDELRMYLDADQSNELFDTDQYNSFVSFIGKDRASELVKDFELHFAERLKNLESDAEDKERHLILHESSSVAGNLGFKRLCKKCRTMLDSLSEYTEQTYQTNLQELASIYSDSLKAYRDETGAGGDEE